MRILFSLKVFNKNNKFDLIKIVISVPCILEWRFEADIILHICQFYENATETKDSNEMETLEKLNSRLPVQIDGFSIIINLNNN